MRYCKQVFTVFCGIFLLVVLENSPLFAQNFQKSIETSGKWYLAFQQGKINLADNNQFSVNRGYLTVTPKLTPTLSGNFTQDVTTDATGSLIVRMKYTYLKQTFTGNEYLTKPLVEFGLVHRVWIDFEEGINPYRSQGTMFLERNNIVNSADYGVYFSTMLGGEMDKDYQNKVSKKYPGKYGSIGLGLCNGGGYSSTEKNTNKVFEGRLTIRPLPLVVPGLQFSYYGIMGKGNTAAKPDLNVNSGMISFEHVSVTVTGNYFIGKGNYKGDALVGGKSRKQEGYSGFCEIKFPSSNFCVLGRYDSFDPNTAINDNNVNRTIIGVSYKYQGQKIILDYDLAKDKATSNELNKLIKLTVEFVY